MNKNENLNKALELIDAPHENLTAAALEAAATKTFGSTDGLRVKDLYREAQTLNLDLHG